MKSRLLDRAAFSIRLHGGWVLSHALFFCGIGAVVYGSGLAYPPLRFITGGLALVWLALLAQKETHEPR